ncbi:FxSxx-COOH system tetratricopeptide repeat protein [Kitasatospora sp. NPDC057015]|uniref:FxSxx-COOH system tetratricopeptide repeat protein n=1 Tax=Kitasatospora sp. NPDC057015 TaxID=3346001 RepID=UPI00362FE08D
MADIAQQFFISYAGPDRLWAEWVGWQLKQAGHRVELDRWNWRTGDDFILRMNEALERADAVVALFSDAYFAPERWTQIEWTATIASQNRLVPLEIAPLATGRIPDILSARLRRELHGLDETGALAALRDAVHGPAGPRGPVGFPGTTPATEAVRSTADQPRLPGSTGLPGTWNVRRRNPDFAGREAEMIRLREGLLDGHQTVVQALHGMGGIGKTQLALEYAHRFAGQYDVIWWIDAEQADQIPSSYAALAERLGIAKPAAGTEHNARTLLNHLSGRGGWLIVLDNAEAPGQIEEWLPQGPGHTLITSRNPHWTGIAHQTGLDVFTRSDSQAYLTTRIPGITPEQADGLAHDLGDLPLALAQAAGVIGTGTTLDNYHRLLTTNTARLLKEGDAPGYPLSVAASVTIATDRLAEHHPDAEALLRLGAFLGPEPVPTAWLEKARPQLTTVLGDPDDLLWPRSALQPLARRALARIDHRSFQIHRLTQAVLRDQTTPEQAAAIRADTTTLLATAHPGDPQDPQTWPDWAALTPHLTAPHLEPAGQPTLRQIILDATHYLIRGGQSRPARDLAATLHEAWETDLGPDHPDTLTAAQFLGHATYDVGELAEARRVGEDTLARRRRVLGDDHPDTLQSANDLSVILNNLGEESEAHRIKEDTLARRRRVLGEGHPDTLQSANSFAATLNNVGEHVEARRMNEDTLARRRRALGDDHPETLHSAHSLAATLTYLGEHVEARRMNEDTLARRRRALGDDHPETLHSAHSLAVTLNNLGEHAEARRMNEDTLARRRRALGDDHPDTLRSAHGLAITLKDLGEHVEARRIKEDTFSRRRRALGDDHPDTLSSAHSLAISLHNFGKFAEARRMDEDTLARRRRALGDDHLDTLHSAHSLAITLITLRDHAGAVRLLEDVLNRRRRILGDKHPDTVKAAQSLAGALIKAGRHYEAQRVLGSQKQKKRGRKKR